MRDVAFAGNRDTGACTVNPKNHTGPEAANRIRQQILWAVEGNLRRAERCYGCRFPRIPVEFNLTGGTSGQYWYPSESTRSTGHGRFRFNLWIASRDLGDFLRSTVPHEVAHYLVAHLYGRQVRPHGNEWKRVMRDCLGAPASRCHQHEVPYPYVFRCGCEGKAGEYRYTRRGFNNFLRGTVRYCPKCKCGLKFLHAIDVNTGMVIHRNPVGKVFLYRQGRVNIKNVLRQLRAALDGYWPQELLVYNPKLPQAGPVPDMAWVLASSWTPELVVPADCTHAVAMYRRPLRTEVTLALETADRAGIAIRRVALPGIGSCSRLR